MRRTSRVPYFQNVYDLMGVTGRGVTPGSAARIAAWKKRTGRAFPAAMREFYTTSVTLNLGGERSRDWTLTLPQLWSEYSNDERARTLAQVLDHRSRPRRWEQLEREVEPGPYLWVMTENQGVWLMQVRLDGSDDPPVYADEPTFLSPPEIWNKDGDWWHSVGRFSDVLMGWFARFYGEEFVPLSYFHRAGDSGLKSEDAPPKPYKNGLWLRTPAEPLFPPVLDYLTDTIGEPERTPRPGDVTTYTFRADGGTVRVTADRQDLPGALSAWWLHAETPDHLAALARHVLPFGTLRDTFRADTDPGRAVLAAVRGA